MSRKQHELPGGLPAAGFGQPFEMLAACHERLHRMLDLLDRLRRHLAGNGADEQARQAARDLMRYFDQAAPQHHRDEELHVFPPLLAQGEPDLQARVLQLQQEHGRMEAEWAVLRQWLQAVSEGRLASFSPQQEQALLAFAELHVAHLDAEDSLAYPRARALLNATALAAMGLDMASRRGLR